jgi:single-strand DNA-binding protein
MLDQNEVFLTGNLKDAPDFKIVGDKQTPLVNFTLPTRFKYERDGELVEGTKYHRCVAWGKLAEKLGQLPVGTRLEIRGSLDHRKYKQDEQTKYITEVKVENAFTPEQPQQQTAPAPAGSPPPPPLDDGEIPF